MSLLGEVLRRAAQRGPLAPPVFLLTPDHLREEAEAALLDLAPRPALLGVHVVTWRGLVTALWTGSGRRPPAWCPPEHLPLVVLEALLDEASLCPGWPRTAAAAVELAQHLGEDGEGEAASGHALGREEAALLRRLGRRHLLWGDLLLATRTLVVSRHPFPGASLLVACDDPIPPAEEAVLEAFGREAEVVRADLSELFGASPFPGEVEWLWAASPEGEVAGALVRLAELLAQGCPPEEVVFTSPAPERYAPILEGQALRLGLPVFGSLGGPEEEPVGRAMAAFADLLRTPGESLPWLRLAETGLVGQALGERLVALADENWRLNRDLVAEEARPGRAGSPRSAAAWRRWLRRLGRRLAVPDDPAGVAAGRARGVEARLGEALARLGRRTLTAAEVGELLEAALTGWPETDPPPGTVALRVPARVLGLRRRALFVLGAAEAAPDPASGPGHPQALRDPVRLAGRLAEVPREVFWVGASAAAPGESAPRSALMAALAARLRVRAVRRTVLLPFEAERRRARTAAAVDRPEDAGTGRLPQELVGALFGPQPRLSVSFLETYAHCPYRALGTRMGLGTPEDEGVPARRRGLLIHRLLAALVPAPDFPDLAPEALAARLETALAEAELPLRLRHGRRGEVLRAVLARRLLPLLARLQEERRRSRYRPYAVELAFGPTGALPPIRLAAGAATPEVVGRVDRVDLAEGRLRLIDYKTGAIRLRPATVAAGLELQLLAYALLEPAFGERLGARLEALEYWPVGLPEERLDQPGRAERPAFAHVRAVGLYRDEAGLRERLAGPEFHGLGETTAGTARAAALPPETFDRLVGAAATHLARLAAAAAGGAFEPRPWRDGPQRACDDCELLAVCGHNEVTYRTLPSARDWEEAAAVLEEGDGD